MKIAFCEPPALGERRPERIFGCSYELYHFPDLANLYLASVLHADGHEVVYLDAVLGRWNRGAFLKEVRNTAADVYVIHSVILAKKTDLDVAPGILRAMPESTLLFHGPEPTRVPEEYLIDGRVTVLRGEPEFHARELLAGGTPPGVSRVSASGPVHEKPEPTMIPYDDLPMPARWIPGIAEHRDRFHNPKFRRGPVTSMMASRGCSYRCLFCVPNSVSFAREIEHVRHFGKKPPVRQASADYMAREFGELAAQGYRSVMIIDDQFLWKKERTLAFCEAVRDKEVQWGCLSRADFLVDPKITGALAGAGCKTIDIGLESLDRRVLEAIDKDLNPETVHAAVKNLKDAGIEPKINIVFGTCNIETPRSAMDTVDQLKAMDLDNVMFSIATPFKGTRFYELCEKEGYLIDRSDELDPMRKAMVSYPRFPAAQLEAATRRAYRRFYLRFRFLWRRLRSIRGPADLIRDLALAIRVFR